MLEDVFLSLNKMILMNFSSRVHNNKGSFKLLVEILTNGLTVRGSALVDSCYLRILCVIPDCVHHSDYQIR